MFFTLLTKQKSHKAKISVSYPNLITVIGKDKAIFSAVGFRNAKDGELFLEQYLDEKIEKILSRIAKEEISRDEIVEIGSLASMKRGMAKLLYIAIAAFLYKQKYRYVVATGTKFLQNYFKKAGLKPLIIADAKKSRLRNKDVDWGSYYDSEPKVMVLDVKSGYLVLKMFLGIKVIPSFEKLYPHLSYE